MNVEKAGKKPEEKVIALEKENADLKKQILSVERSFAKEKEENQKTRAQKIISNSGLSKDSDDKKQLELKLIKLTSQVSDFEKLLFSEREGFEKERTSFDSKRKSFEAKFVELSKKLSDLEVTLEKERMEFDLERKEYVKVKSEGFQTKCVKDNFERERRIFQTELKKLTKKVSELSAELILQKRLKSELQSKYDEMIFADEVKKFEAGNSNQKNPDVVDQSPQNDSTSSSKIASSTRLFSKIFTKSNNYQKDQNSTFKLFDDTKVDKSVAQSYKKGKKVWKVKSSNSVKSDLVYSVN